MSDPPTTPIPIPLPQLAGARTLMLVGGTFDPPHVGHTRVPAALRAAAFPDGPCGAPTWLIYVPAVRSPLKPTGPSASDADRVAMLRLALESLPMACVWTDEIDRAATHDGPTPTPTPTPSFTIDTLRRARAWLDHHAPQVVLRLVIGADQAAQFHRWREPREIIQLASPLVMGRRGVATPEQILRSLLASDFWTHDEIDQWRSRIHGLRDEGIELSATQVREAIASGRDVPDLIQPQVLAYIRSRGLYRPPVAQ